MSDLYASCHHVKHLWEVENRRKVDEVSSAFLGKNYSKLFPTASPSINTSTSRPPIGLGNADLAVVVAFPR